MACRCAELADELKRQGTRLARLEALGSPDEFETELRAAGALAEKQSKQLRDLAAAVERLSGAVAAAEAQRRQEVNALRDVITRLQEERAQSGSVPEPRPAAPPALLEAVVLRLATLEEHVARLQSSRQHKHHQQEEEQSPPHDAKLGHLELAVAELRRQVATKVAGAREAQALIATKATFHDVELLVASKADRAQLSDGLLAKADATVVERLAASVGGYVGREEARQIARNEVAPLAAALAGVDREVKALRRDAALARSAWADPVAGGVGEPQFYAGAASSPASPSPTSPGTSKGWGPGARGNASGYARPRPPPPRAKDECSGPSVAWVREVAAEEAASVAAEYGRRAERAAAAAVAAVEGSTAVAGLELRRTVSEEWHSALEGRCEDLDGKIEAVARRGEKLASEVGPHPHHVHIALGVWFGDGVCCAEALRLCGGACCRASRS